MKHFIVVLDPSLKGLEIFNYSHANYTLWVSNCFLDKKVLQEVENKIPEH